jgi:hypothetical protein
MNVNRCLLIFLFAAAGLSSSNAQRANVIRGQVIDEDGLSIEDVKWRLSAIEELIDGKWTLMHYSGRPEEGVTDGNGCFVIPSNKNRRYDLQFNKDGFAPTFLFQQPCDSNEITVTLKRGESIHGTVTRFVDGKRKAVVMKEVKLQLPCRDFWYQQRTFTDEDGKYEFRACAPPIDPSGLKRKWYVAVDGKTIAVEVRDGEPVEAVDFEIVVESKETSG